MKIRKPVFYDQFRCLASDCPDSCCQDWAVTIDDATREKYLSLPGSLGEALRNHLMEEDGEWILQIGENGRCPMWRQDGLCRIQAEMGEEALSCVCTQFPRLTHDYGDFQEWGLELSCPEAARLILTSPWQWTEEENAGRGEGEYDETVMEILKATRERMIAILKNPRYAVGEALAIALLYGYHVQSVIDGGEDGTFSEEAALQTARDAQNPFQTEKMLSFFRELNILRPHWQSRLQSPTGSLSWPEQTRNLAIYFMDRYYLQAVSDYDLACRVKFMVISCLLIRALGGDFLETAQEYSKEIENDTENLDAILDAAYMEPAFADRCLLGALLK